MLLDEVLSDVCHMRAYVIMREQEPTTNTSATGTMWLLRIMLVWFVTLKLLGITTRLVQLPTDIEPHSVLLTSFSRVALYHSLGHLHTCTWPSEPVCQNLHSSINRTEQTIWSILARMVPKTPGWFLHFSMDTHSCDISPIEHILDHMDWKLGCVDPPSQTR